MDGIYFVYILTNKSNRVFYVGVTDDLSRRVREHKEEKNEGFTKRYQVKKLVYFERFHEIKDAIEREKALKKLSHANKVELIVEQNPKYEDLYEFLR